MNHPLINLSGRRRLPLVLQAETAECALACIAMVSAWFGRHEDLGSLRQSFSIGSRGTTVNGILDTGEALGLAARAVRCELNEIGTLAMPAILHWDFNHYVVLKSASKRGVTIHDPACGIRQLTLQELGNHFTGIAIEFSPIKAFEARKRRELPGLIHYLGGLSHLLPSLSQLLLLSVLLQLATLATPFYMQLVVDEVLVQHDVSLLTVLACGFIGLCLFSTVTQAIRGWAGIYLTNQLSFTLGTRMFHHLLSLPAVFFTKRQMGDIVSRFGSLRPIQDFLAKSSITILLDGLMAITTLIMMCIYSPLLAVVALAFLATYLISQLGFYVPLRRRHLENIAADARTESNFMESIRSISAIKRFCVETSRSNDWQNRFADSINCKVRLGRLTLVLGLFQSALSGSSNVVIVYLGAHQVLGGHLSIGMLYAFLAWRSHLSSAVKSLVDSTVQYLMLSLHLERLADISEAVGEEHTVIGGETTIAGDIALLDAAFRYSSYEPWIFRHLNVRVGARESLAIIGPSGCGKSTLLSALMGIIHPDEGYLWIDHANAMALGTSALRRSCASVMQSDALLAGSIQSNITFGETTPDFSQMQRAARLACIHDDIVSLPMGYESLVGEMGATLSAGQIQRILIARALYRQPRILFLDEGTAHLDKEMEIEVMHRLLALHITCIFTTHNRAVVALADKVLMMGNATCRVKKIARQAAGSQTQKYVRSANAPRDAPMAHGRD